MSHPMMDTSRETKETKELFSIPQGNVSDKNMQKMKGPKVASGRDSRDIFKSQGQERDLRQVF